MQLFEIEAVDSKITLVKLPVWHVYGRREAKVAVFCLYREK